MSRPKVGNNLKVVPLNLETTMVEDLDKLALANGKSRSEITRIVIEAALTIIGMEDHKSLIVLKELNENDWTGFDPALGRFSCYGSGSTPELALDSFLNEEEDFIEQLNTREDETGNKVPDLHKVQD